MLILTSSAERRGEFSSVVVVVAREGGTVEAGTVEATGLVTVSRLGFECILGGLATVAHGNLGKTSGQPQFCVKNSTRL